MPMSPAAACLTPRCPGRAVSGGRGRCQRHVQSQTQRGYGAAWQALSRAQRRAVPYCARCGATDDLTADHIVSGDPSRLQTLCRSCNVAKRNHHTPERNPE
jgi:5-methylcytosine-specific restriction endonuclease McrA